MELVSANVPMTRELVQRNLLQMDPFTLVDIGCSGGIHWAWRVFGDHLRAVGVEPMLAECERLQAAEPNPNVKYRSCFMGLPRDHPFVIKRHSTCVPARWEALWSRLSTCAAVSLCEAQMPPAEQCEALNAWHKQTLADPNQRVGMGQLVEEGGLDTVDLIKLDTDGDDFELLHSCQEIFESRRVLGVILEVNYFGTDNDTDHTFHNTDRFLRSQGFGLFGLTVRPYSRRDMPAPFRYSAPGITTFGAPLQGDALYLRDLADPAQADFAASLSDTKLLKFAALCEIVNLPDCAAETLNHFAGRLEPHTELESLRDLLVPQWMPETKMRYREYMEFFNKDVKAFMAPVPVPPPKRSIIRRTLGFVRRKVKGLRSARG